MSDSYRFGNKFKLLAGERLLLRDGQAVALPARAFDLLLALLQRAGSLLSKAELLDAVWEGVVVEESNLAVQIAALRKVLGAESIATVTGVGYRFALPVTRLEPVAAGGEPQETPSNLPLRRPTLYGRDGERDEIAALLRQCPLTTICGPAGIGKTLLAQVVAGEQLDEFPDGVYWVDLAPLADAALLPTVLASTLGLSTRSADEAMAHVTAALRRQAMLLVLDNAEHIDAGVAAVVAGLLHQTRRVVVLCTSQVPLKLAEETVYRLDALAVPDEDATPDAQRRSGAVQLFAARACAADRHFQLDEAALAIVLRICRQLDGNALAIELAAGRAMSLGLAALEARLHDRFRLLAPLRPDESDRHNALRVAFDWSYGLLTATERQVLRRLGVFAGGFALDWAAACVADETLDADAATAIMLGLVERSLLTTRHGGLPRYSLLETGRFYALDRLAEAGEMQAAQARHAEGVRWLLDEAYQEYIHAPCDAWLLRYGPELENLRAALAWAQEADPLAAVAIYGASWPLWHVLDLQHESRAWYAHLQPLLSDAVPPARQARFWEAATFAHSLEFPHLARSAAEQAAARYAAVGDDKGRYGVLMEYAFNWRVDDPSARAAVAEARRLEGEGWPVLFLERGYTAEGVLEMGAGHFDETRRLYRAAVAVSQRAGYQRGLWRGRLNLADLELAAGNVAEAVAVGETLREEWKQRGGRSNELSVLLNLTEALIEAGRLAEARVVAAETAINAGRFGLYGLWVGLDAFAYLMLAEGEYGNAARLLQLSDQTYARHGQHERQPNEARIHARTKAALPAVNIAAAPPITLEETVELVSRWAG